MSPFRLIADRLPVGAVLALRKARAAIDPERRALAAAREVKAKRDARVLAPLSLTVHAGPFAGMRYLSRNAWGTVGPYLLGSYEEELHPHLERLLAKDPPTVVDVGAAEGYYAVGAALRLPNASVIAADVDPVSRRLCRQLASLNNVTDRVRVERAPTPATFQRWLQPRALVIVDCEGCELRLLQPDETPALRTCDLIVELHDFVDPNSTATISRRFAATHSVTIVDSSPREADLVLYPALARLPRAEWEGALDEHRPMNPHPMRWAVLEVART